MRANAEVLLFTRPRRFGKTLNLSMLARFLERRADDLTPLFEGLAVWREPDVRGEFQAHPVIQLSLKEVKATSLALRDRDVSPIHAVALVFCGQRAWAKSATV